MDLVFYHKDGTLCDTYRDCPYHPDLIQSMLDGEELRRPNGLIFTEGYLLVVNYSYPHSKDIPFFSHLYIPSKYLYAMEMGEMIV